MLYFEDHLSLPNKVTLFKENIPRYLRHYKVDVTLEPDAGFGFAKVYSDKTAVRAIDLLKTKVLPIYRQFNIPLDRILTDNGKEYTTHWPNGKHEHS